MEGSVGKALHNARLQQKLTVEEVARGTKIRPARIVDLENDDYMHFPNLAYARSFLLLYAKYLRLDITKYPTVEVGSSVGTGDYQYLRNEEAAKASRNLQEPVGPPEKPRWLIAFFVFVVMVVLGVIAGLFFMQFMRLGSVENLVKKEGESYQAPSVTPTPMPAPASTPVPSPTVSPLLSGSIPIAVAVPAEVNDAAPVLPAEPVNPPATHPTPEVRRAEAVISGSSDAEILAQAAALAAATPVTSVPEQTPEATPAPLGAVRELKLRVTRKTKIRVVRDNPKSPSLYFGYVNPQMAPLSFKGAHFWIKSSDPGALKITVDGQPVTGPESGVEIQ
jgi:cytoskeletal protein RodZ